ncbi:MAG: discoidin domain-containing protein [Fermentimonas sp.]
MDATYISSNQFSVDGDKTDEFLSGRRLKIVCSSTGLKYLTVYSSNYSGSITTVTTKESDITSDITTVLYGIVAPGDTGSLPEHDHSGDEGSGGFITTGGSGTSDVQSFTDLIDTPTTYSGSEGKYLKVTASGIEFAEVTTSGGGTSYHDALLNLDYDSSGHTGFAPAEHEHSFLSLTGTPTTYSGAEGKYLRATASGTEWATVSGAGGGTSYHDALLNLDYDSSGHTGFAPTVHEHSTFSGTEVFVAGDATVTGTMYAHIYDSYSPLTIKDGGVIVIQGDGSGTINFPRGATISGVPLHSGSDGAPGATGEDGSTWLFGEGAPKNATGVTNDWYLDTSTYNIYRKDTLSSDNLLEGGTNCSASHGVCLNAIDGDLGTYCNFDDYGSMTEWWKYDFGAGNERVVTLFRRYCSYSSCVDFSYQGSNNDTDWETIASYTRQDDAGWHDTGVLDNSTAYRYYRIYITYAGNPAILYEIEFLGDSYVWDLKGNIQGPAGVDGVDGNDAPTTFLGLSDTPSTYGEGKYLRATASGTEWATISGAGGGTSYHDALLNLDYASSGHTGFAPTIHEHSTFSGTEVFVAGDATVTGTMYAHIYDSYSPLTIKDGGVTVIEGSGIGSINLKSGTTIDGTQIAVVSDIVGIWYFGNGIPSQGVGNLNDFYLDSVSCKIYRKDLYLLANVDTSDATPIFCAAGGFLPHPGYVVDGNETTYEGGASAYDEPFYFEIDFGEGNSQLLKEIIYVAYENVSCANRTGEITARDNSSDSWVLIKNMAPFVEMNIKQTITENFESNASAYRYWRITWHRYDGWNFQMKLYEIYFRSSDYPTWEEKFLSIPIIPDTVNKYLYSTLSGIEFTTISGEDHSQFSNLDYESSGHTGFASTVHEHSFLDLMDTPTTFSGAGGKYLYTTSSGIEFIDGVILTATNNSKWLLRVTNSGTLYTESY